MTFLAFSNEITVLVPISDLRMTNLLVVNEFLVVVTVTGAATGATTVFEFFTGIVYFIIYPVYNRTSYILSYYKRRKSVKCYTRISFKKKRTRRSSFLNLPNSNSEVINVITVIIMVLKTKNQISCWIITNDYRCSGSTRSLYLIIRTHTIKCK